jgi:hypothetical protein
MCPIQMLPGEKKTGTLHVSTVRHLYTPAVHKHYKTFLHYRTCLGFAKTPSYINVQWNDDFYHNVSH